MKAIYKFHVDCGRMGDLEGLFIADKEEVAARIGCEIGYGECLGKHSDISEELTEGQLSIVSESESDIEVLERLGLTSIGTDPMCHSYRDKVTGEWVDV